MGCPSLLVGFLLLLAGIAHAQNSTFNCAPNVYITPPYPNSKLLLTNSTLKFDLSSGRFYLELSTTFSGPQAVGVLPLATLTGYAAFQAPGVILFSFPSDSEAYCFQSSGSSPPLCPTIMASVGGPFVFAAYPSSGPTEQLIISSSTSPPPGLQTSLNFLGAQIPLTYACVGTCAELQSQVPTQQNVSYTVCRSSLSMEGD